MTVEPLGAMLVRLREGKGYVQHQVAEALCRLSGTPTVSRHEVSRWERELRSPSDFWLRWLSTVFEVPVMELEEARERSRNAAGGAATAQAGTAGGARRINQRERVRPRQNSSLTQVALRFEHRATSVQFNGTYEKPEQATAVIGMFRELVAPDMKTPVTGANGQASATGRNSAPADGAGPRVPTSAGAAGNGKPAPVQMGIRYTAGPGVPASGSNRSSTDNGTRRKQ